MKIYFVLTLNKERVFIQIYFVLTLNKEGVFIQILFYTCLSYIKNVYSTKSFSRHLKIMYYYDMNSLFLVENKKE